MCCIQAAEATDQDWSHLPGEILEYIASYLQSVPIASGRLVCSNWRVSLSAPIITLRLHLSDSPM